MIKKIAFASAAVIAGDMLTDRFLLKDSPDDPTGFILAAPGFGMDDVAKGLIIGVLVVFALKFAG